MGSPSTDEYVWSKCIKTTASTYTLAYPTVSAYTTTPLVYAIQVRWKASDLNALETNPTKSGETITPTPTSAAAATSDQTAGATSTGSAASATGTASSSPSSSDDDGSGLSTGAKIGLGVGIGVAAVVLGILAYLVWRRRSRNGRELVNTNPEGGGKGGAGGKKGGFSELQDTQVGGRESTSGGEATELASPEGTTWNSSTWGGSTVISPLTPRPDTAGTTTGGEHAAEMEVPETRHELAGHVTDFAEMPASNQFVAELPGDTPVQHREKWS
ncbi:hypothetical protein SLS55_008407 [Diplodia seriata]|uniref:Uncharacterized protein n=1 Tax=Diplodia seriata TaxID=420778 RepID=A0ABR3CAC2_9PEZI